MNALMSRRREVGLPAVDRRDEAGEREDAGGRGAVGAEAERVTHHRAIEKPPKIVCRAPRPVPPTARRGSSASFERGVEGVGVGIADARDDVPVVARPARDLQRRARGDDVEPPLGVEHVGEAEQVVLVGAAAVVEDEQPLASPAAGRSR